MINFDNSVTNIAATPGIITATTAEAPVASQLAPGTIFINSTTGVISQSNGTSFSTIGGGGGTTPGIDSVLAINQGLTAARILNVKTFSFTIDKQGQDLFKINGIENQFIGREGTRLQFTSNSNLNNGCNIFTQLYGVTGAYEAGLSFSKSTNLTGGIFKFGDYNNAEQGTKLIIDDGFSVIKTTNKTNQNNGIYLDQANNNYYIGTETDFFQFDSGGQVFQSFFGGNKGGLKVYGGASVSLGDFDGVYGGFNNLQIINSGTSEINTYDADNNWIYGLKLNFTNSIFSLGDPDQHFNGNYIEINDGAASNITINGINNITFVTDEIIYTGTLTASTSGSVSGQHLKITINGTPYVIELKNP